MSNTSEFITIIRPSFMSFCKDACRAAAFNHLLFRIAGKAKDQPKEKIQAGDILWYAKTEQITEEMSNAWGVCKIRKEVNALIDMGVIGKRNNPEWGADRTKHFCFGQQECKKFLALCQENNICVVHLGLSAEVTHLIYLSNANDTSIKCTCSKHQMEAMNASNANDTSIRAIPIDIPTEDDYKDNSNEERTVEEERTYAALALAHARADLGEPELVYHSYQGKDHHTAISCTLWCRANHATCEDFIVAIEAHKADIAEVLPDVQANVIRLQAQQQGDAHATILSRSDTRVSVGAGSRASVPSVGRHAAQETMAGASSPQTNDTAAQAVLPGHGHGKEGLADERHPLRDASDGAPVEALGVRRGVEAVADPTPVQVTQTSSSLPPATDGAVGSAPPRGSGPRRSGKGKDVTQALPAEAVRIMDEWDSLHKKPFPRTEKHIQAAALLVACRPTKDELQQCERWLYSTDRPEKPWYRKHGVRLQDIAENIGKWQSLQEVEAQKAPAHEETKPFDYEEHFRKLGRKVEF